MLKCAWRDDGEVDSKARVALYIRDLKQYPLERVREVLQDWPRRNKFFPTYAELVDEITKPIGRSQPEHRIALPRHETKRDPRVAEGLRDLARRLGGPKDPEFGRVKAQWEIDAEQGAGPNEAGRDGETAQAQTP